MHHHVIVRSSLAAAVLLSCPVATHAQVLIGTVTSVPGDSAVAGAAILIYSGSATVARAATADSAGRFEIRLPGAGTYALLASHPDYPETPTQMFTAELDNTYHVEVRMARTVVAIEAIEVNVNIRRLPRTAVEAANKRIRENRNFGIGRHMTREEIEQSSRNVLTDLIESMDPAHVRFSRMLPPMEPNGRGGYSPVRNQEAILQLVVRKVGKWCPLRTYVDGVHMPEGLDRIGISVDMVGAIEVYSDAHPHGGYSDPAGCGVALLWTHGAEMVAGARIATSNRWQNAGALAGVAALLGVVFAGWF